MKIINHSMNIIPLREILLFAAALIVAATACTPAFAARKDDLDDLLDMSSRFDKADKQDFQAAIDRANDCTSTRDFSCSEKELARAAKAARSGQDKKILAAARRNVTDEKARAAAEEARQREHEMERERYAEPEEDSVSTAEFFSSMLDDLAASDARDRATRARLEDDINRAKAAGEAERKRREEARQAQERQAQAEAYQRRQERERAAGRQAQANAYDRGNQRSQEAERAAEQQRREREAQQREEQRRKDEQAQRERAQEQERQRQREEAERQARMQAEKEAAQQRRTAYLSAMKREIRLTATKCPGGEGQYYVTGKRPSMKQEVSCIDVHYQASCPGSWSTNGVANNFVGMSGCFGDTYQIEPKPPCAVEQVRVQVTRSSRSGCK